MINDVLIEKNMITFYDVYLRVHIESVLSSCVHVGHINPRIMFSILSSFKKYSSDDIQSLNELIYIKNRFL